MNLNQIGKLKSFKSQLQEYHPDVWGRFREEFEGLLEEWDDLERRQVSGGACPDLAYDWSTLKTKVEAIVAAIKYEL
jgi:hypothetical protein